MVLYPLTTDITGIDWVLWTPVIKEIQILAGRDKDGNLITSAEGLPPQLVELLNFSRIIIIQRDGRTAEEQGLQRTHESRASEDRYVVWLKTTNDLDTRLMFDNLRHGLINQRSASEYAQYNISFDEDLQERGRRIFVLTVMARRVGVAINFIETLLFEQFIYTNGTRPVFFTPPWSYSGEGGSTFAYADNNELRVADFNGGYSITTQTPELHGENGYVNRIRFSLRVLPTGTPSAEDEWQINLIGDGSTYMTIIIHFINYPGNRRWWFKWAGGNEATTIRAVDQAIEIELLFYNNTITLYADGTVVFENEPYDVNGTVKQFEIKTPFALALGCNMYFDNFIAESINSEYLS